MEEVLPLGSVVYLRNSKDKVMIISRGAVYEEKENEEYYYDYIGCLVPYGFDRDKTLFFNHHQIDEIVFRGYMFEEEKRLAKIYLEWKTKTNIPQGKDE